MYIEKRGRKNPVNAELFIKLIDNSAFIGGVKKVADTIENSLSFLATAVAALIAAMVVAGTRQMIDPSMVPVVPSLPELELCLGIIFVISLGVREMVFSNN